MTETVQGGPITPVTAAASEKDNVPSREPEPPPTGINPDMPASSDEASGRPKGFTWGDNNCV